LSLKTATPIMAAERLTQEVKIGDLPRIELGAFNWQGGGTNGRRD
jgi:hypothetical protein